MFYETAERDAVERYAHLRDQLLGHIDALLQIGAVRGCPCADLRQKLIESIFNLVVLGQFKRGKTSLINALLGAEILPTAVVPLTSIPTVLIYGEALRSTVHFEDDRVLEIRPENLAEYVTERGNPKNVKGVAQVVVAYPSPYLKDGVRIIDTPGVGSVYQHNTDAAYQYLPKSDAALFLLSVDQPISQSEVDFLKDVERYASKIFFVLNKADYVSERDLKESIAFTRDVLSQAMGREVTLHPVSARLALEGKRSGAEDTLERSRLPAFAQRLNRFLVEEKGQALLTSVTDNLLRLIAQAQFELALELKALTAPLEELRHKITVFEAKKDEVLQEKQELSILLDGQTQGLIQELLDPDLEAVKQKLAPEILARLQAAHEAQRGLPLKALHEALEERLVQDIKAAYDVWRSAEDERLSQAFAALCRRFVLKIQETVDTLLKFSSELFAIPFDAVKTDAVWTLRSTFYYKLRDEPVGLQLLTSSLTFALPRFIGEKRVMKILKDHALQVIDAQAGRLRYDFMQRLDKSKLEFRWQMLQTLEATIEGIETAIRNGMSQRTRNERELDARRHALAQASQGLDAVKEGLRGIRAAIGRHDA